ncbi:cyclase family protein [Natrinema longum]|uniref:Cyclase family protein n=1 Tax=Natrinema longum TaxID=370324 RepID=A0A8A2UBB4_9EURY|nr:cyclase family protein [Natrinema longum]MBZ6493455.1 cyclase family protein [Natrinema longum]QSW85198.1 cyclase family protein [Natrinema longum]
MHVDLTWPIETGMQTYPGDPAVAVRPHTTHEDDGARVAALECGSHTGTHVDAPAHTEADGQTLESYPLERFVFDAVRIDCRDLGAREPIPADRIPGVDADLVACWTGWDAHWGTDRYLDHPYLSPAAAKTCVERGYDVAVDALNPDPTPTDDATEDEPEGFQVHHALLGNDLLILENLTNLESVGDRFELRAYPMALASDGAPVRAVGVERME